MTFVTQNDPGFPTASLEITQFGETAQSTLSYYYCFPLRSVELYSSKVIYIYWTLAPNQSTFIIRVTSHYNNGCFRIAETVFRSSLYYKSYSSFLVFCFEVSSRCLLYVVYRLQIWSGNYFGLKFHILTRVDKTWYNAVCPWNRTRNILQFLKFVLVHYRSLWVVIRDTDFLFPLDLLLVREKKRKRKGGG